MEKTEMMFARESIERDSLRENLWDLSLGFGRGFLLVSGFMGAVTYT